METIAGVKVIDIFEFICKIERVSIIPGSKSVYVAKYANDYSARIGYGLQALNRITGHVQSIQYDLKRINVDELEFKYKEFIEMTDNFKKVKYLDTGSVMQCLQDHYRFGVDPNIVKFNNDYIILDKDLFKFYINGYEGRLVYTGNIKPYYIKHHFEPLECEELELLEMGYKKEVDNKW